MRIVARQLVVIFKVFQNYHRFVGAEGSEWKRWRCRTCDANRTLVNCADLDCHGTGACFLCSVRGQEQFVCYGFVLL